MRKYLILLLLCGFIGNSQNLYTKQIWAKKAFDLSVNTEIGGVSATISTPALLATKLGISVGNISNFTIVGSDIKCKITGSYSIPATAFLDNTSITGYNDDGGLVTALGSEAFKGSNLGYGYFKNALSCGTNSFASIPSLRYVYIPRLTNLGGTVLNNSVFSGSPLSACRLYVDPSLATNNSGNPDGDIQESISLKASVRYVTNFTTPNQIADSSIGSVYNNGIQLIDNATSTNPIDYYETYLNGVFYENVEVGNFIINLTQNTSYNITAVSVDVFFNKSAISPNVVKVTNNSTWDIFTTLVSYYKLDSNAKDVVNKNNGVETSISYVSGKISNAASFNGTSSKTIVGNPSNLQLTNISISCWVKSSGAGSGDKGLIFKRYAYNIFFYNNKLATYSYGSPSGYKDTGINICDGTWKHIVLTQQSGVTNGTKLYIDGVLVLTTTVGQTAQTDNLEFGTITGGGFANFILDEANVYNAILTQAQIDVLYNSGSGTTL